MSAQKKLSQPWLNIVLVEPQIPPNTGNIARLCAATECHLILVGKLGFELSDRYLKRAGLDYWEFVSWEHIEDENSFFESINPQHTHMLTVHTDKVYHQIQPSRGDYLLFGKETKGLPKPWLAQYPESCYTIPMLGEGVRSLNLASAASIVTYDALRQLGQF